MARTTEAVSHRGSCTRGLRVVGGFCVDTHVHARSQHAPTTMQASVHVWFVHQHLQACKQCMQDSGCLCISRRHCILRRILNHARYHGPWQHSARALTRDPCAHLRTDAGITRCHCKCPALPLRPSAPLRSWHPALQRDLVATGAQGQPADPRLPACPRHRPIPAPAPALRRGLCRPPPPPPLGTAAAQARASAAPAPQHTHPLPLLPQQQPAPPALGTQELDCLVQHQQQRQLSRRQELAACRWAQPCPHLRGQSAHWLCRQLVLAQAPCHALARCHAPAAQLLLLLLLLLLTLQAQTPAPAAPAAAVAL